MRRGKVVFCKKQTREIPGMSKVRGYLIREIGGIEQPSGERGIVEYWTSESIEKIRRRYRKNLIERGGR